METRTKFLQGTVKEGKGLRCWRAQKMCSYRKFFLERCVMGCNFRSENNGTITEVFALILLGYSRHMLKACCLRGEKNIWR